ncbi:helix-turn-helix domain-containing protein [Modestobacter sp. I12A-02628]|uniref:IclR family transcriptional regulator n=1 Tax=Goekera deserti TaxID=2497753 RepID=A0A7K3WBL5_9ACTN|nr:IclR family transcriptional regulator [Goekera deserti]MPQ97430.1 helix-turn-helix domain-containing protein [Goekera deserti]NDI47969.1 helix-turn-helix domain-containing protein [Goekera deserti]NEL53717.1 IclR family transcriptional regulator [Goekera deserti]
MDTPAPAVRGKRPPVGEPVIDRALGLLGAFDPDHRRLTLSELGRRAGLPLSTARRQAERLVAWGALERTAAGEYVVGLRLWEIASLAPRAVGLREVARPFMEDLYEATRHHVLLAVLDGDDALLVERRSSSRAVTVAYQVGERLPLHCTGVGLVLLAHASSELQARVCAGEVGVTPTAPAPDPARLRQSLQRIRHTGVAVLAREFPAPVVSVAAALRGEGDRVVAALSIVVPAGGASFRMVEPAVRAAARAVSRGIGAPGAGRERLTAH